ncbi:MAG: OmpA family protein [Nitrospira sp.]|nr:OmpA family protein [Nitrospira sp.]
MSQGPSQVSSGNIAPKIVGPLKESKEVVLLAGLVVFLGGSLAAAWYYGQNSDKVTITPTTEKISTVAVPEIMTHRSGLSQTGPSITESTPVTPPIVAPLDDVIHADVYFEVGRKGLTDEAKAQLAVRAELLKHNQDYGVLIQGYTDQQGSASYNMKLGLRRAETVKAELLNAGVAEHRMKVMSLGEDGVLCVDDSDICRHDNRRVHLEIRKIGEAHMMVPASISSDPAVTGIDASPNDHGSELSTNDLHPISSEPTPGS